MDEILTRLQETAQVCAKTYEEWRNKKNDTKAQESLHNAIHELRKVASRLEIELAVRERQDLTSKPIPIPSHKSSAAAPKDNGGDEEDDGQGSMMRSDGHGHSNQGGHGHGQRRRRPPHSRSAEQGASGGQ